MIHRLEVELSETHFDWFIAWGIMELERYLAKYARFYELYG